jgi:predicted Zn-dependent peptidase
MTEFTYPALGEKLYQTVLPNGLTVMVLPRKGFSRKTAYFVTDFGAVHTSFALDGNQMRVPDGVAHYLEHKLFELQDRDVTAEFAALGAAPNAFTSHDMTAYFFFGTENFEKCLHLLLEFVSTPYFTEESVAREQGIIGQEIGMNLDSPDSRVFENLMGQMYRVHPVSVPILGTVETIARITPQILYDCHRAFYTPSNMLLCVVGDVDPDTVADIAMEVTGSIEAPDVSRVRQWDEEMTCPIPYREEHMAVAMPTFQLGFKCEPLPKGEAGIRAEIVADLAAEALFGESSELYLKMYEQGLIDTSFGGGFETMDGLSLLMASGDSDDPEAVRDAILAQAKVISEQGISDEDFLRMKRSALGRRLRGLDGFDGTCFRLCAYKLSGYDYFEFPKIYEQVRESDIREFLARVVTPERTALSVILPL